MRQNEIIKFIIFARLLVVFLFFFTTRTLTLYPSNLPGGGHVQPGCVDRFNTRMCIACRRISDAVFIANRFVLLFCFTEIKFNMIHNDVFN